MSEAMKKLQEKVGVGADGHFGKNTAKAIAQHYELSNERAAHLMGQASHESGHWRHTRENLNYSAESMSVGHQLMLEIESFIVSLMKMKILLGY